MKTKLDPLSVLQEIASDVMARVGGGMSCLPA